MFHWIDDAADAAQQPTRRRRKLRVGATVYTFSVGHYDDGIVRRTVAAIVDAERATVRLEPGCCYECSHVFGPRDYFTSLTEARARFRSHIEASLEGARRCVRYWTKRLKAVDSERVAAAFIPSPPLPARSMWDLPD